MKLAKTVLSFSFALSIALLVTGCGTPEPGKKETALSVKSADGSDIAYGTSGQGKTALVFIHGWLGYHGLWQAQLDHYSRRYKVVWLDLAGHGVSTSQRTNYTIPAFAQDVAAVVNAVDVDKVILVGHSMGGPVAIEAAKILGNKVTGIVGVDTFYTPFVYPDSEKKIHDFVRAFKTDFSATAKNMIRSMFTPQADPDYVASLLNKISEKYKSMGVSAMYGLLRWDLKQGDAGRKMYEKKLRNINAAPTGKEKAMHESVVLIHGVGHFIAQVKPDAFNRALDKFILEFNQP